MTRILNVLIIDDHPLIINIYQMALKSIASNKENIKFNIDVANDCHSAGLKIEEAKKRSSLDLVLLDINLPPSKKYKLFSGDDVGVKLRALFSDVKMIVSTSYNDNYRLHHIFKTLNPEGLLVKTDFDNKELTRALTDVIDGATYYSRTVTRFIRQHISNQIVLDEKDREILYHLSKGVKMKDLPRVISLSLAGIERRKRHLRTLFNTQKMDDNALISSAKEKGFI